MDEITKEKYEELGRGVIEDENTFAIKEQIADEIYRCLGIRTSEDMYYFNYTDRIPYIIDYILERERKAYANGRESAAREYVGVGKADNGVD